MAMLLRMGGIPTRVVTGFSPGGYSKSKRAWIVRDTDAHSWVEAWFDDWGWVTFDPTPAGTPARSQIAALERPAEESGTDRGDAAAGDAGSAARIGGVRPDLLGTQSGPGGAGGGEGADDDGGVAWWWIALAVPFVLALIAWLVIEWRRRSLGPAAALDRAVAELEAALRRAGRPAGAGTTLQQLEQRLGGTPAAAAYLRALRAGRYAPSAPAADGRRPPRAAARAGERPRPGGHPARALGAAALAVGARRARRTAGIEEVGPVAAGDECRLDRRHTRIEATLVRPGRDECHLDALIRPSPADARRPARTDPPFNAAVPSPARRQPASAARRVSCRISDRIRSSRGSADSSTCVIAAATAGWRSAIRACIWCATARYAGWPSRPERSSTRCIASRAFMSST